MAASILEQRDRNKSEDDMEQESLDKGFEKAFDLFRTINDFEGESTSAQFQV